MDHVVQFFTKLASKMREYQDRLRGTFYSKSLSLQKNSAYNTPVNLREFSRTTESSRQSTYSKYQTPAMFASARRMAQRFVKSAKPAEIERDDELNGTICGKKIDWEQISLDSDEDDDEAGQKFWSEKRYNGTWHVDQLLVCVNKRRRINRYCVGIVNFCCRKSEWAEQNRNVLMSPASTYQTFFTSRYFSPNCISPKSICLKKYCRRETFPRTSSLLDLSKTDKTLAPDSPNFSPGRTFDISCNDPVKRRISLPVPLKDMFNSTDLSLESNSLDEMNSLAVENRISLESLELISDSPDPIFDSSRIDEVAPADTLDKIDENHIRAKPNNVHDSGLGNRSSFWSNDTATAADYSDINLNETYDDERFWKKGRNGIYRWYSFKNNVGLCLPPLSKDA